MTRYQRLTRTEEKNENQSQLMKVFWLIVTREMFWFISHPQSFKFRNSIIFRYKEREWRISSNSYTLKLGGSLTLHHVTSGAFFSVTHKVFVISPTFFSYLYPLRTIQAVLEDLCKPRWRSLLCLLLMGI